jgi:hypothetical protein
MFDQVAVTNFNRIEISFFILYLGTVVYVHDMNRYSYDPSDPFAFDYYDHLIPYEHV